MRPNMEQKFNSPEDELEWLRNRYKEESLEAKKGEKMIEEEELAAKVLYEHTQKDPEKTLGADYRLPAKEKESLVAKILNLPPESHDKKIEELLAVAEGKGVLNAISIVRKLKDPHLEDDLHRALIQFYIKGDISKQKIKKPLSQALNMVLYEISLPREKEEEKKEKNFKEFISAMEQFYNGMMILNQGKEEYLALEIGLPAIGEEIVFTPLCREPKVPYWKSKSAPCLPTPELKKKRRLQYIQARRSERRFGGNAENLSRSAVKNLRQV